MSKQIISVAFSGFRPESRIGVAEFDKMMKAFYDNTKPNSVICPDCRTEIDLTAETVVDCPCGLHAKVLEACGDYEEGCCVICHKSRCEKCKRCQNSACDASECECARYENCGLLLADCAGANGPGVIQLDCTKIPVEWGGSYAGR